MLMRSASAALSILPMTCGYSRVLQAAFKKGRLMQKLEDIRAAKARRAVEFPDHFECLRAMVQLRQRMYELGWGDIVYCPKDGTVFEAVEFGSSGVHDCHYEGEWPTESWWLHDGGDLMPSRPIMFRLKSKT